MTHRIKLLLTLIAFGCCLQITNPLGLSAQAMDSERERQDWENEQDRRRADEGEHFDEAAYEFEKTQMARRQELEERRMRLEESLHEAFRALDQTSMPGPIDDQERQAIEQRHQEQMEEIEAEFRSLDEENHQYWIDRQRSDMERHMREWEAEQERRREEEGEHFDEAAYEFERSQMERRRELEERRIRLDEEIHEAFRALEQRHEQERQALHSREQEQREELEAQFRDLDDSNQRFWADKQRSDMDRQAQDWESEQERRREDEGEYFDESAHEFEKAQMARRQELEKRRIDLEEQRNEAFKELATRNMAGPMDMVEIQTIKDRYETQMEELEAQFRALEDQNHQYWMDRQRTEQESQQRQWEDEQQRRRLEEGEHFDEAAYEFEKAQMARRQELEGRRMQLEEEQHEAFRALEEKGMPGPDFDREREAIERRHETRIEELEAEFRALDDGDSRVLDQSAALGAGSSPGGMGERAGAPAQ